MNKFKSRAISGVLLLDKPTNISSNLILQKTRQLYRAEKAGHTGTLDPLATGLLPICFGEATKFAQYLLDADKTYIATLRLGIATTTGDSEGDIIATCPTPISFNDFQQACQSFTGKISQMPPMYSALKHEGKPLYEYARQGITIERFSRDIDIYRIDIQHFTSTEATIIVRCSKGTYIRTLCEDIAKHCQTFAHLTALRRTSSAGFAIEQSHSYTQLQTLTETERDALLLPCDILLSHLPSIQLNDTLIQMLQYGQHPTFSDGITQNPIRIYNTQNEFIGLATYHERIQKLKPLRLMNTQKITQP